MASSPTYWLCRCGKAHPLAERACVACGNKQPFSKALIIGGVIGVLALVSVVLGEPSPKPLEYPADQKALLAALKGYEARWKAAPNALMRKELLVERDRALAQSWEIDGWTGIVLGVNPMADGVGISIDIGGPRLLAGTYVTRFIDTTIRRSNGELIVIAERLKPGKRVKFSGRFEIDAGALAEISYTEQASATTPQYLIRFNAITPIEQ